MLSWEFARRRPWLTRVEVDGVVFGGGHDPAGDARVARFHEAVPDARRILELGCLEGGLSTELARRPGTSVVAVDPRPANVEKARFLQRLLPTGDVTFFQADLERTPPSALGRYDAVFCCQALQHLPRPALLLDGLRGAAPTAFLWTHHAASAETVHGLDGLPGRWYVEPDLDDPAAGLSPRAFWPTLDALVARLRAGGYATVEVLDHDPDHPNGPAVTVLARDP